MALHIRQAVRSDVPLVHGFIRKLAEYEKLAHEAVASELDIEDALFGREPKVFSDIAEWDDEPAGFALWFYSFSTFHGRHGIYIEDLYVEPTLRGKGIGKALLRNLAQRCMALGLPRLQWWVLNWNAPSIAFYQSLGAKPMEEWTVFRLTGQALEDLAAPA